MPRTFKQNEEIKDKRKAQILEKSLILFANVGIKNVTMDEISKYVGCSHGLLYHYFSSKEDLYEEHRRLCKNIVEGKIRDVMAKGEPNANFLVEINQVFIDLIFSTNQSDCYYLYLYTLAKLFNLTNAKTLFPDSKDINKYFNEAFQDYLDLHPSFNKPLLKEKIKCYLIFISGLAINYIKFPGLFTKKIDHMSIYNTFFEAN